LFFDRVQSGERSTVSVDILCDSTVPSHRNDHRREAMPIWSNEHRRRHRRRPPHGFSLIEALIVLVIMVVLAAYGLPALQLALTRAKLSGTARQVMVFLGSSRVASMRLGRDVVVRPDYGSQRLVAFVDEDSDRQWDVGEDELASMPLADGSGTRGVHLMGPNGVIPTATEPAQSVQGLTLVAGGNLRVAVFQPDGSVRDPGGLRVSDGRPRPNVFEVRIDPPATARVELLKFVHEDVSGVDPIADPPGSWYPQGGGAWEWY
jgi:prepilin-type N-terminal cleavage/methylation domain-containing protein